MKTALTGKICTKCGVEYPATADYFPRNKVAKDGLHTQCKNCKKKAGKEYRENNEDKIRRYYQENKERIKKNTHLGYRRVRDTDEFKQKLKERNQRRIDLIASTQNDFTPQEWSLIKAFFGNSCAYCGTHSNLCQDHFVPLTKGGGYSRFNIIPACKSCNSSKGSKPFGEWYKQSEHYSPEREEKVWEYFELLKEQETA